ncbi:ATP-dependent DNA helicase RecQ [Staphylococcus schleiferi subsp. coagulans]|uniref:RecQ family ATP-dependent DNA helicase n=1 Tax=Staphylococcus coagulans TaxID=74706 RepID=UPI0015FB60FB|nr:ATP-dependent DNA helicase RecQ [Staphylococcus coagulans]MBA8777827.1 ATP-dependent DNA helicase RecQ [Staphylococcus coagulans]
MLKAALKQFFGFTSFRPGQEEIITSVLQHQNTLGILPTGTGKTLCYQLPTYMKQQPTLIISPLISLMDDQVMQMKMKGEQKVVAIHSGLEDAEKRMALAKIKSSRFVFVSPEFILQPHYFNQFKNIPFGIVVLDEVHCLSEWGFDFRPHYALIGKITQQFENATVLALTATATIHLQEDIEKVIQQPMHKIQFSMDRPNIALSVELMSSHEEKVTWLIDKIAHSGPTIVYVSSKKVCLELAQTIYQAGYLTGIYHGDLSYQERLTVQQQFLKNDIRIIVATSAFGMGINKPDIRTVIHFHLSPSPSSYMQEIGRAGRDGQQSQAIALFQPDDQYLMESLATGNIIREIDIQQYELGQLIDSEIIEILDVLNEVFTLAQLRAIFKQNEEIKLRAFRHMHHYVLTQKCRRQHLLSYFQMPNETASKCCDRCETIEPIYEKNRKKVKRKLDYSEKLENLFH